MEPNLLTLCVCVCVWPQRQRKELKRRRRSGPSRRRRWSRRRPSPRPHSQNQRRTKWNRSRPPSRHRSADKRMETRWKRTRENVLEARHKRIFLLCITVCPRHMVYNVSLLWRNLPKIFELFFSGELSEGAESPQENKNKSVDGEFVTDADDRNSSENSSLFITRSFMKYYDSIIRTFIVGSDDTFSPCLFQTIVLFFFPVFIRRRDGIAKPALIFFPANSDWICL